MKYARQLSNGPSGHWGRDSRAPREGQKPTLRGI